LAMYPTKILLATDGSKESTPAVRTAVELAKSTDSELHVVHAISTVPQRPYPRHYERAKSEDILQRTRVAALVLLDEKMRQTEKMGGNVADSYYREGDPVKEVLRLAEELEVGLIITGGRRLVRPRLFWSSSFPMQLFCHAKYPVLIVRGDKAEQPNPTDQR
jgi:nucleotide-binding universal stress UspA family protein